ncbi:MAG: tetratricopeptide repeat protein [Bacteroidetes bacterium]|nr:tetratricopeptide repeat protein [Bacteroidota bacterium]
MKNTFLKYFILISFLIGNSSIHASSSSLLFKKANELYRAKQYEQSITLYDSILKENKTNYLVYYNLGNSHFKQGNIAAAILNYERAKTLNPSDEDINYNLKIAYSNTVDKIEPIPLLFYQRWWQSFLNMLPTGVWSILSICILWLAFAIGAAYLFAKTVSFKRNTFLASINLLILSGVCYYISMASHRLIYGNHGAIVMEASAYITSSPDEKSTNLFMLHQGTKVEVTEETQGWKK